MFDHMDGNMRALAKKKTQWKVDLFIALKLARQKLSKYRAEVTPMIGMHLMSAQILDPFRMLRSFWKWDRGMDMNPEDKTSYTTQFKDACLKYVKNEECGKYQREWVNKPKNVLSEIFYNLQWLQDPVEDPLIHTICPAMMMNIWRLTMWWKRHPDEVITQYAYWLPPGSIWIHCLKHQGTGGKQIQISMITTPTQWRLAAHFGHRTKLNGCATKKKCTESMLISPMWRPTYSVSYHMVAAWSPVLHLGEMWSAGGIQNPQARPFTKQSLKGSFLEPITGFWQAMTQNWIQQTKKTTWKWRKRQMMGNSTEWPRSTTIWRCGRAAKTYMLQRGNLVLKTNRWQL